jgi:hypothetical protein
MRFPIVRCTIMRCTIIRRCPGDARSARLKPLD